MFNLSMGELLLLGVIGLVVLGPKQLPEVARVIGRLLNELRRASAEVTNYVTDARDATQKSLLEAREEYNKVLEKASLEEKPKTSEPAATELPSGKKDV